MARGVRFIPELSRPSRRIAVKVPVDSRMEIHEPGHSQGRGREASHQPLARSSQAPARRQGGGSDHQPLSMAEGGERNPARDESRPCFPPEFFVSFVSYCSKKRPTTCTPSTPKLTDAPVRLLAPPSRCTGSSGQDCWRTAPMRSKSLTESQDLSSLVQTISEQEETRSTKRED